MSGYFIDLGWQSNNKYGELLCGDHVEVIRKSPESLLMVLADGLGSGVRAKAHSTLTAKIISTMLANSLSAEQCVQTVAAALPVCEVRKAAYSSFTIIRVDHALEAEIIQFANPRVFLLRSGKQADIAESAELIAGKTIHKSKVILRENDVFIAVSNGVIHAGRGKNSHFRWMRGDVINFMERIYKEEYTAKTLATILNAHCALLYAGQPEDDITVCALKVRRRCPVNLILGPPADSKDIQTMLALFFSKMGKHIVCGGTTSRLAAEYLGKPLEISDIGYQDWQIPPLAKIEGVDLVTEGVITLSQVLEYVKNYLQANDLYEQWSNGIDGASRIAKILIEEATDINFYVGRAMNPAHQDPNLPINFNLKMRLVDELADSLKQTDKKVKVSYF